MNPNKMTPKEKAQEMYDKMLSSDIMNMTNSYGSMDL
jgi:hypothetical protein